MKKQLKCTPQNCVAGKIGRSMETENTASTDSLFLVAIPRVQQISSIGLTDNI
jgi:hypothetical protein